MHVSARVLRTLLFIACLSVVLVGPAFGIVHQIHVPGQAAFSSLNGILRGVREAQDTAHVYFAGGTYILDSTLVLPSNVSLEGAGKGITVLQAADALTEPMIKSFGNSTSSVDSNIAISNLTLRGNCDVTPIHPHCDTSTMWNDKLPHPPCPWPSHAQVFGIVGHGLNADFLVAPPAIKNLTIQKVELTNIPQQGIWVEGENVRVLECEISDVGWNCVQLSGRNLLLSKCLMKGSGDNGAEISFAEDVRVTHCMFRENRQSGLLIKNSRNVLVSHCRAFGNYPFLPAMACRNRIGDTLAWPIYRLPPGSSESCRVKFASCVWGFSNEGQCESYGFEIWAPNSGKGSSDVCIFDCVADSNAGAGVLLFADSGYINGVSLVGNRISRSQTQGIRLETTRSFPRPGVHNIRIHDNHIHDIAGLEQSSVEPRIGCACNGCKIAGIYVSGADTVRLVGNEFRRISALPSQLRSNPPSGQRPFYREDCSWTDVRGNYLCRNRVIQCKEAETCPGTSECVRRHEIDRDDEASDDDCLHNHGHEEGGEGDD